MKLKFDGNEYEVEGRIVFFVAIAIVCVIAYLFMGGQGKKEKEIRVEDINVQTPQVQQIESRQMRIYITGCVKKPGVYYLKEGSLIIDAVNAAGGFSKKASKDFNMAWRVKDNCMVTIPCKGEKFVGKICSYSLRQNNEKSKNRLNDKEIIIKDKSKYKSNLVNINNASKAELMTLNGVGEVIAQRIIDYRKSTKFMQVEDLKKVSGIGDKTFENMKESICTK